MKVCDGALEIVVISYLLCRDLSMHLNLNRQCIRDGESEKGLS